MRLSHLHPADLPSGCLSDLTRFLRRDDPDTRPVFWQLVAWATARNDLLPILTHYAHDHRLVLAARECVCVEGSIRDYAAGIEARFSQKHKIFLLHKLLSDWNSASHVLAPKIVNHRRLKLVELFSTISQAPPFLAPHLTPPTP
jgi:hypothetical protein